jgi:MFS family permease
VPPEPATPPTPPTPAPGGLAGLVRALRHRNFRLYFLGQGVSLLGTWMQQVALNWLVYRLAPPDQQALLLGLVNFATQVPALLLLPVAGVLLDRYNRFHLVVAAQALAMLQAFALAALTFTHLLAIWHILALAFVLGCVNAFDLPARQSFLPAMVTDRRDLANAIALNSSVFNAARLIGPAVAGVLIAAIPDGLGESVCFLLNGLSYLAVLLALLVMEVRHQLPEAAPAPLVEGLLEGVRYLWTHRPTRAVVLLVACMGLLGLPYAVLLPLLAGQVLGGQADTYGVLLSAAGTGALIGAVYLATRSLHGVAWRILAGVVLFSGVLLGLAAARQFLVALPLLVLGGFGMMMVMVSSTTVVQTLVPDDKRGRVMSLYTLSFLGLTPFGSLLAGWCAQQWGTPAALAVCGGGSLLGVLWFAVNLGRVQEATDVRPVPSAQPAGRQ